LRSGGRGLKAENAELRLEIAQIRSERDGRPGVDDQALQSRRAELRLPVDVNASAGARALVTECLSGCVDSPGLDTAQLLISELVGNACATAPDRPVRR